MPTIARGDLATPVGLELNRRRWVRFQRWFDRNMRSTFLSESLRSGVPMLFGGRSSDRRGGRAEFHEAKYFLSFDPPDGAAAVEGDSPGPGSTKPRTEGAEAHALFDTSDNKDQRLKRLEDENRRLMILVAKKDLEIDRLMEVLAIDRN